MDRRSFLKKAGTAFIFTASGLWLPKTGILRPAEARMSPGIAGGGSYGCSYPTKDGQTGSTNAANFGNADGRQYLSSSFTASASYTMIRTKIYMKKYGSMSLNIYCYIWSNSLNKPSSSLATATNTIATSSLTTSYDWYTYNFTGLAINATTMYHVVLYMNSADANNYGIIGGGAVAGQYRNTSADTITWNNDYNDIQFAMDIQSCS